VVGQEQRLVIADPRLCLDAGFVDLVANTVVFLKQELQPKEFLPGVE
jgi:hypothetical protein